MTYLLADVGATNTRCAIVGPDGEPGAIKAYENRSGANLPELLEQYLASLPSDRRPTRGVLAVAAPIRGDSVKMINIDWHFSADSLRQSLGLNSLQLLNDFEALAIGLPHLATTDLLQIGGGEPAGERPKAVLGPGSGLGVASLIPTPTGWQAVSGEGGHVTLPAVTTAETRLIDAIRERFGHCSAERLLSGPGLELLHATLNPTASLTAPEISALAEKGEVRANETLAIFFELLGTVAANLALTVGAFGGVYIGGGIVPRHAERFSASGFRRRFEAKGRYGDYLRSIPTFLITADYPTLTGLAAAAADRGRTPGDRPENPETVG